jgi:hypothetical protein
MKSKTLDELASEWRNNELPEGGEDAEIGYMAGYRASTPQWVSVDDRLPDDDGWVLLIERDGTMRARFIYLSDGCSLNDNGWLNLRVVYWMPFPEPPEEAK